MDFRTFLALALQQPAVLAAAILTLGVILVNGWTDAPNAIATSVATHAMSLRSAVCLAAICNFLGLLVMTLCSTKVAVSIYQMVDFGGNAADASIALCVALFSIVLWATLAWRFGIPTSESHALIAGLSGAAIALHGSLAGINAAQWNKVLLGLLLSTVGGFFGGFLSVHLVGLLFRRLQRGQALHFFRAAQIAGSVCAAFLHGAQDGQKFVGVFLLAVSLAAGQGGNTVFQIPLWLMLLCAVVMALGTSFGGGRIIQTVGVDMVRLEPYQGFASDLASAGCLLSASVWGLPVSTTHTKTSAIMGVGAAGGISAVNWSIVRDMLLAWLLTFPGCGLLSFLSVRLILLFSV